MIVDDVTDKLNNAVVPIAPVKVVVPDPPAIVRPKPPSSVLLKVTLALLEVIRLVPVKLTGLEKMRELAPDTVILLLIWIVFALVNERFVGGELPPTMPPNDTIPPVPARKINGTAPFNVLEKLMLAPAAVTPPLVLSRVGVLEITTGPVRPIVPPLVVIFPPTLIAVDPV